MRVIAVSSAERQAELYSSIPTWREQGANSVTFNWRAIFGPKGITPPQVAYWENIFQRLTEAPDWKSEMDKRSSITQFTRAAAMKKRMEEELPEIQALLVELELVKK